MDIGRSLAGSVGVSFVQFNLEEPVWLRCVYIHTFRLLVKSSICTKDVQCDHRINGEDKQDRVSTKVFNDGLSGTYLFRAWGVQRPGE
jgi:hypothetical protein